MEEELPISPPKIKGSLFDNINNKTSITCTNVPEGLFDTKVVEKHFSKFGKVVRIRLLPKKQMCIVEYEQQSSVERAMLNAGAFDGFMFDVTRTKPRMRRKSKIDDDPDWLPDPDVEEELNAMKSAPTYRISRQKTMDVDVPKVQFKPIKPIKKKFLPVITTPKRVKPVLHTKQSTSDTETPIVTAATTMSTIEAATELHKLRSRISVTPDEKWRTLDARDRILRAWGGAGSRVVKGGATIGTCPDKCPEKELLHRQAEHQVMTLETIKDSDGSIDPWRAVKQYSRSSADQEMPMCYELRPAHVLMTTCAYLIHEIADTNRQVSLADWFHFMWDRFRGIRKDITQQALCCAESICMVEMCARFHAHCAARLADLEHTQFDQKLNTDNLTKCLQTLKHMYADVSPDFKPNEAEFRGYIALLNLGDSNFWWEIKQLPREIQKSESITFAIQIYISLDSNNYVKFFRLIRERATYLQACILLRYFNDVRARSLARIVKAYAPRGGSKYPAEDLLNILSFETIESMKSFVNHYGLRFAKNEEELTIILNRYNFIEDSDPYPLSRAINLIESKRQNTVGEVISGGPLPSYGYENQLLYTSFTHDGRLKETALVAEDIGYDTRNDSNKNVKAIKLELQNLLRAGANISIRENRVEEQVEKVFEPKKIIPRADINARKTKNIFSIPVNEDNQNLKFSFQPATHVAPIEAILNSPEKVLEETKKNIFTFSKPYKTDSNLFSPDNSFDLISNDENNIFGQPIGTDAAGSKSANNVFKVHETSDQFKSTIIKNSIFGQVVDNKQETKTENNNKNIFMAANKNLFSKDNESKSTNLFAQVGGNLFKNVKENMNTDTNIFSQCIKDQKPIFESFNKSHFGSKDISSKELRHNGDSEKLSPGSLFKNANQPLASKYNIFQSKNKAPSVADNIFNSVKPPNDNIYEFDSNDNDSTYVHNDAFPRVSNQEFLEEEKRKQEKMRVEEEKRELQRQQEEKRKEAERKKVEELKEKERRKKEEQKKQEELRKKLEEEKLLELKRKAEEEEQFKKRVDNESIELLNEFINEIGKEEIEKILTEENNRLRILITCATENIEEICLELLTEICDMELKAEIFRRKKLMTKWFRIWRMHFTRNYKRRSLLEDTPVWLPDKTPREEANYLRRITEVSALQNMNAFHRGYKFTGKLKQVPPPKSYNMLDLIRSPLLKRMKQIGYPYDKCFFWKVTLVSPGSTEYLYRKINLEEWLHDAFNDHKRHDESDSLIHVGKYNWNNLLDFAVSISLINKDKLNIANEALSGTNGVLFYATEQDVNCMDSIEQVVKHKYKYQKIPIAVIAAKTDDITCLEHLNEQLKMGKNNQIISDYKIFIVEHSEVNESINTCTKSAVRWLAKNFPKPPPLEIDYLKSVCQRYLGNEIWCKLKSEKQQTDPLLKDLYKLVSCYNTAVDKLAEVVTNSDLCNYTSFPLEFENYLDKTSPYPKPYEFVTSNTKTSDNTSAIKRIMQKLKLPSPTSELLPNNARNMQDDVRKYCKQISWFPNPDEVVCKVVAVLPNQFSDLNMSCEDFNEFFERYDFVDLLNVIVYEKINRLNNFENRFAVYTKSTLQEFRNFNWLFEIKEYSKSKQRVLEYEDDVDYFIEAKRRKIEFDSLEHLMLVDKDSIIVEKNINNINQSISSYDSVKDVMSQLEMQLAEEKKKSDELENILRLALSNV